jgi:glycerol transport system ATP-binding protein
MARIELRAVAHSYSSAAKSERDFAVKELDLTWEDGGAYALLGPSGCGKTTLLGIMSGLLKPSHGTVWMDGRDVTLLPPAQRNVAQVFQFPVIYDTMTVFDNLAFPLRNRAVSASETRARVEHIAELLELGSELPRKASGLPGDLKQRISLGRGLVRKDVAAILLDEPLTVIDPHLRWLLRRKLMEIHAELRVTLIYVTHDQLEAMTLADHVVVMRDGYVLQRGTPQALFEQPEHTFVGHFIGSPGMNLLPCTLDAQHLTVAGQRIVRPAGWALERGEFELGVRPEFLRLETEPGDARLPVRIRQVAQLGGFNIVSAQLGELTLNVKTPADELPQTGEEYWLALPAHHTHLYRGGHRVELAP